MKSLLSSITMKICLLMLAGEAVVLALLGVIYVGRIAYEADSAIAQKALLPVLLHEQNLIDTDRLVDRGFIGGIVQEEVLSARLLDRLSGEQIFIDDDTTSFSSHDRQVQLSEFSRDGMHQLAALVPVQRRAGDESFFYLRLQADRHAAKKRTIVLYYGLGALGILALSALLASAIAFRLFVPRIRSVNRTLAQAERGDFSVRVETEDLGDELGQCVRQVNSLIAVIEKNTARLHVLNRTGEALASALNRDEVIRVVVEVIEEQFDVSCQGIYERLFFKNHVEPAGRYSRLLPPDALASVCSGAIWLVSAGGQAFLPTQDEAVLFVPIAEDERVVDILVFQGRAIGGHLDPVTREFLRTLARLVSNSFNRIRSLHELTQAESKYRALFMTASGDIFRMDSGGRFEDINPACVAMLGYESAEEMQALATDNALLFGDLSDRDAITVLLEEEGQVTNREISLRRKDGSVFPASVAIRAVKDEHGRPLGFEGHVLDMTERTRREQAELQRAAADAANSAKSALLADLEKKNRQLQKSLEEGRLMQKQLLQTEKMAVVGTLAGGIAHDLNNMLAGTVSYPDLLLAQLPPDHAMRQPLEVIRRAGGRAVAMVNDLLTLSHGSARLWEARELDDIIEQCLQDPEVKKARLAQPELQLKTALCCKSTLIRCAPLAVQRAIVCLITHSMTAAGKNGTVEISTEIIEMGQTGMDSLALQAGQHVVLTISDNGPGIATEHRERVFEPFYLSKLAGSAAGSTGLGLAVAWNVVQEHHGTIVVRSREPGGTSFIVYLPLTDAAAEPGEAVEPIIEDYRGKGAILVVDDEPLQRDIAGKMLAELGYQVYLVASGEAALDFIAKQEVDLVLLDMLMSPGISGRETYEQMIRIRPGQKTLIVSGYSQSQEIVKVLEHGAGGVLKKPYSIAQLGRAVLGEIRRYS